MVVIIFVLRWVVNATYVVASIRNGRGDPQQLEVLFVRCLRFEKDRLQGRSAIYCDTPTFSWDTIPPKEEVTGDVEGSVGMFRFQPTFDEDHYVRVEGSYVGLQMV